MIDAKAFEMEKKDMISDSSPTHINMAAINHTK
jgi:hypothetical protein